MQSFPLSPLQIGKRTNNTASQFFFKIQYTNNTQMKPIYSIPKVSKTTDLWYVHFRYEGKQFRYKMNLNKIEDLEQRAESFNRLCIAIYEKLRSGWNPNIKELSETKADYTFLEALDFALSKKKPNISKKTALGYEGTIKFINTATKQLRLINLPITEVKRVHIKTIMEKAQSNRCWSNNAYNKHLNQLKAVISELIQYDIIESNPSHNIKNLRIEESVLHRPPTDEEWAIIKKELMTNHYSFWVYVSLIAYWGMRPNEIFSIKLEMIDMENELVVLPPKYTKNRKKYKILPIIKYIKSDFEKMNFKNLPKDYYLFGSFKESGKGNMGKNQFLESFIPAPTKIKTDTATRLWHKVVNIGLGINVTMYSAKKYGANKKLKAGITVEAIQKGMGHAEKEVTYIYLTEMEEQSRKKIKDETPEL